MFDMPPSIICPVPFPARLITTHTLTTTAVANNTYDAIVAAVGRATDCSDDRLLQLRISRLIALAYKIPCR